MMIAQGYTNYLFLWNGFREDAKNRKGAGGVWVDFATPLSWGFSSTAQ